MSRDPVEAEGSAEPLKRAACRAPAFAFALAGLAGCALDAPRIDDVLAPGSESAQALAEARARPEDPAKAVAAARLLFQAADQRMQRAIVAALAERSAPSLEQVLSAEDEIPGPVRDEILGFCSEGLRLAEQALFKSPTDKDAMLHAALHLSLVAWVNGPARSLFAGYGPRLTHAIDRILAEDPLFDHGAPLRLQGRFLARAPWPYGDKAKAKVALERSAQIASVPVTHLFLGDLLHALGDTDRAVQEWQKAVSATDVDSTRSSGQLHREQARSRLLAVARRKR